MLKHTISFATTSRDTMELPAHLLRAGGAYDIQCSGAGVVIVGNRDGLLYLAEVLVRAALGDHAPGFHVHLPMASRDGGPNVNARPELTVFAARADM